MNLIKHIFNTVFDGPIREPDTEEFKALKHEISLKTDYLKNILPFNSTFTIHEFEEDVYEMLSKNLEHVFELGFRVGAQHAFDLLDKEKTCVPEMDEDICE